MPILTNSKRKRHRARADIQRYRGTFTVTASVNALSVTFTLTNLAYNAEATWALLGDGRERSRQRERAAIVCRSLDASSNASWLQLSPGSTSGVGNALDPVQL
jgi:hypothetical protein